MQLKTELAKLQETAENMRYRFCSPLSLIETQLKWNVCLIEDSCSILNKQFDWVYKCCKKKQLSSGDSVC